MFYLILVVLLVCIGLPLLFASIVWHLDEPTKLSWLVLVADAAVFVILIFIVGRWDIAGYYTRYLLTAVFLAAILWSLRRHRTRRWGGIASLRARWTRLVSLAVFGIALAYAIAGIMPPSRPVELTFPLQGSNFLIAHGGDVTLLNHHSTHPEQRYAADITAINDVGFRASGILPYELDRYAIFGKPVVSPCDGHIVKAHDGLPDMRPPMMDSDNAAGNHVIVRCGDVNIELAHLRQGSVVVAEGQRIATGAPIGKVGNSGNTTEPHLHVHAVHSDTKGGVPMAFGGRVPVRNSFF